MVCPRCEQDYLCTFEVPQTDESGLVCRDCDALWLAGVDFPYPGWADRSVFMEERDLKWGDLIVGPKTGEDPPPANVRVRRRLPSRPDKPAPNEPPWGEVGGVICPYCRGNLINAELPPGLKFSFCSNCESVWPHGAPLSPISPTWLAQFLDDHNATWDEVSNLGRRREE